MPKSSDASIAGPIADSTEPNSTSRLWREGIAVSTAPRPKMRVATRS